MTSLHDNILAGLPSRTRDYTRPEAGQFLGGVCARLARYIVLVLINFYLRSWGALLVECAFRRGSHSQPPQLKNWS